jgi:hypothetical protein
MSLSKFWQTISGLIPVRGLSEEESLRLSSLNPKKIYIENVRSILGVSYGSAKRICETAVRQGFFQRYVEFKSPEGAVVAVAPAEKEGQIPKTVHYSAETADGFLEEVEAPTESLTKTTFYRLNDRPSPISFARTA